MKLSLLLARLIHRAVLSPGLCLSSSTKPVTSSNYHDLLIKAGAIIKGEEKGFKKTQQKH